MVVDFAVVVVVKVVIGFVEVDLLVEEVVGLAIELPISAKHTKICLQVNMLNVVTIPKM